MNVAGSKRPVAWLGQNRLYCSGAFSIADRMRPCACTLLKCNPLRSGLPRTRSFAVCCYEEHSPCAREPLLAPADLEESRAPVA
jgi:hypothetical protein